MSETYEKVILQKIEKASIGMPSHLTGEIDQQFNLFVALKNWVSTAMGRPLAMLVTEPIVLFISLYVALSFGVLYNFFAAVPLSLARAYGLDGGMSGLAFVAISIGCLLATLTTVCIDGWLMKHRDGHSRQMESMLLGAIWGSFGLPIGLFWFGWTTRQGIHWASPTCALIVFAWGNLCIFVRVLRIPMANFALNSNSQASAINYLINIYGPKYGASALAANAFSRYAFAAAFPLFTVQSK